MMRFIACLNDGRYINIQADRMDEHEDMLRVYACKQMVALVDVDAVVCAFLTDKQELNNDQRD